MATRRFPPLDPARMTEAQRKAADAMMESRKSLDGPFNGMLRSPDLGDRLQRVGHYVRFMSPVPASVREIAILLTARHWTAQFEWYALTHTAKKLVRYGACVTGDLLDG